MTCSVWNGGLRDWTGTRDDDGFREYSLKLLIYADSAMDGPQQAMNAAGTPTIGSFWNFGNDSDPWAFCLPSMTTRRHPQIKEGDPGYWWINEYKFSTKPRTKRCQDTSIENPLEEPPKISGNFSKTTRPLRKDRDGNIPQSSSHEPITGIEKDKGMPRVSIEINDAGLGLNVFSQFVDTVNDAPLWGVPAGGVKLSDVSFSRQLYGTCNFYYTKRFEFEIDMDGWSMKDIADRGYKHYLVDVYGGEKANPDNFFVIRDKKGAIPPHPTMLKDGEINPDPAGDPQFIPELFPYPEANFLLLGIPSSLE